MGDSAALDVSLVDNTFPTEDFEVLHGQLDVKWERIAPGSNVTHAAVLKPLKSGYFNFTSAEIRLEGGRGLKDKEGSLVYIVQWKMEKKVCFYFNPIITSI